MALPIEQKSKIILGLDPGTQVMGYGVIEQRGSKLLVLQMGVIHLEKHKDHFIKLKVIYEKVTSVIAEYLPDEVAIEAPFYGVNVQSMLKLGRAQGVAIAAALARDVPVNEYLPKKVKMAVTGNGNSSKEQVAAMLKSLFNFTESPEFLDATDALAVAVCHHYQGRIPVSKGGGTWKAFLAENPKRVKTK
jgi:crossover junction endodeoxyribonuclease RuvC